MSMNTTQDPTDPIQTLLRLAAEASPGPRHAMVVGPSGDDERPLWWVDRQENTEDTSRCCWVDRVLGKNAEADARFIANADARYIAAASPDAVTALCEEVVRLRETVANTRDAHSRYCAAGNADECRICAALEGGAS